MSEDGANNAPDPTSDVGSDRANEKTRGESTETSQWRMMLEMQNEQMRALIQALNAP